MRPPSLYSHMDSKNDIYDAMYAQAWTECRDQMLVVEQTCPAEVGAALRHYARAFFDFSVGDLARHQLMNQRTIAGFEPSPAAYAPAVEVLQRMRQHLIEHGITAQEDLDLYVALVGGLIDAQLANDPGGERWSRLLDRAIDMYVHDLGIETESSSPPPSTDRTRR